MKEKDACVWKESIMFDVHYYYKTSCENEFDGDDFDGEYCPYCGKKVKIIKKKELKNDK